MSEFDYEKELEIDIYNLHTEIRRFIPLRFKYRKEYARAKSLKDRLKENLPIRKTAAKVELDSEIGKIRIKLRKDWKKHTSANHSSAAEDKLIVTLDEYKKAYDKYFEDLDVITEEYQVAVEEKELLYGAVSAVEGALVALQEETKLYLSGYYDRKQEENKEYLEMEEKKTRREIKRKLKRKE